MATLTRHRRAPVGQPRLVLTDGSSGLRVSLYGREDPHAGGSRLPLRTSRLPDLKRDRDAPSALGAPTRRPSTPVAGSPGEPPPQYWFDRRFLRRHSYSNPTRINPHPDARLAHMSAPSGDLRGGEYPPSSARDGAGAPHPVGDVWLPG
ncbi:hypothetical protein VZT92_021316 [Zoarces viviparus]|uniref:Uncharacterized protein n=1 Tax=Zoarces viviparus TaxID=48416 RepID=A0AAW1EDP7_ZOAVI